MAGWRDFWAWLTGRDVAVSAEKAQGTVTAKRVDTVNQHFEDRSIDASGNARVGVASTGPNARITIQLPPEEKTIAPPPVDDRARNLFIGRGDELRRLDELLLAPNPSAVAITAIQGMAGVGKSYLADHFALTREDRFGGYIVLPLDPGEPQSAETLLQTLADRLKVQPRADEVKNALGMGRVLLHIENVDSAEAAKVAGRLAAWFAGRPLVMTGRMEGLGRGRKDMETIVIEPFSIPDGAEQLREELDYLGAAPVRTEKALDISEALGGLPLAIHLAAGYLAAGYSADEFLKDLATARLNLDPEDPMDAGLSRDPRRLNLAASFRISLDALARQTPKTAPALAALGHLPPAGFGPSLGAAVMDLEEDAARRLLMAARKLSLVESRAEGGDGRPRWRVHPLIAMLLREEADEADAHERMSAWFLARLPQPTEEWTPWHELNAEHPALAHWLRRIPAEEGAAVVANTQYGKLNGPWPAWAAFCERLLENEPADAVKSNALWLLANCRKSMGQPDEALAAAEEKAAFERERGADKNFALARGLAADIYQARGELDEALRILEKEALPAFKRLGDVHSCAQVLGRIADIYQARGELDEALRIYKEERLPAAKKLGDVRGYAVTMGKIADIHQARGELDEALRIYQEDVLPVYERLGDVRMLVVDRANLALHCLEFTPPRREEANRLLCRALTDARRMNIPEAGQIRMFLMANNMTCDDDDGLHP